MTEEHSIRTETMARIYAQQGHYRKAADIYRHLLERDPSRADIAATLAELQSMQNAQSPSGRKDPAPLVREWIRLALRYRQLQRLQRMKQKLASIQPDRTPDF